MAETSTVEAPPWEDFKESPPWQDFQSDESPPWEDFTSLDSSKIALASDITQAARPPSPSLSEVASQPIIQSLHSEPLTPEDFGAGVPAEMAYALNKTANGFLDFFNSTEGAAVAATGPLGLAPAAAAGFAAWGAYHAPEQFQRAIELAKEGKMAESRAAFLELTTSAEMMLGGGAAVKEALSPAKASPITPEVAKPAASDATLTPAEPFKPAPPSDTSPPALEAINAKLAPSPETPPWEDFQRNAIAEPTVPLGEPLPSPESAQPDIFPQKHIADLEKAVADIKAALEKRQVAPEPTPEAPQPPEVAPVETPTEAPRTIPENTGEIKVDETQPDAVHKASVEQAIREGKPVHPEVLADYPDLKPNEKAAQSKASVEEPAGPGGTVSSDVGTSAELSQLTDSLKSMAENGGKAGGQASAFNLGESMGKLKDAASNALVGLKAAAGYLRELQEGRPVVTSFTSAVGDRHLALSESAVNARKFAAISSKAVPDARTQEAISDWIDTGGDSAVLDHAQAETKPRYRQGYEAAKNLTLEQVTLAKNIKNYFEARLQDAINAGILEDGIEDYIHRIYEKDSPWKLSILNELRSGIFTGRPALAKQRVFEYDFEAEKAGLTPIKSFIKRVAAYDMSLNKAIADRQIVKEMMNIKMPDGRPMIDVAGVGVPTEEGGPTLIKPHVKPTDADTPINHRGDYKPYDHPSLRKWKWGGTDEHGNPILFQGDVLVHPDALGKVRALFERSRIRANPIGRAALDLGATVKQTMLDLSGFHPVQITVHGWEHRTFKPVGEIDFTNPDVRGLVRGGLVVGEAHGYELFAEGLSGSSLTRFIPKLGPKLQAYTQWLFNEYIPRLKVATGLHALERNRARFPHLSSDEVYHLTGNQMNAAFGELNYEMLGRSKTTQDALRLALLAPDFLEARGRFAAQATTKYGREQFTALALGAATLYLTARIINKQLDDEWHFEPKNAFAIVYNGKAYSLRTVQGDLLHLATEPARFMFTRLNPIYGRSALEFLTERDQFGRKRTIPEQLKDLASIPTPISLRGVLNPSEQSLWESFWNAFGVTNRRSSATTRVNELASDYQKKHHIRTEPGEFIYDADKDPFRAIKNTARYDTPEATAKEIAKAIAKGDVTRSQITKHFEIMAERPFSGSNAHEGRFFDGLSADNKKIYEDAKKERQTVLKAYWQALLIYDKSGT